MKRDPLQSSDGWQKFTAGWLVGGLSGVAWGYVLTQVGRLSSTMHPSGQTGSRVAAVVAAKSVRRTNFLCAVQ